MTSEQLYNRLLIFAQRTQKYLRHISITSFNSEYITQLIRSSASPGANYIEALEASSRKDFTYRLKICRKELKESIHWFTLIENIDDNTIENSLLISEARELIRIFTASILTAEKNQK